MRSLKLVTAPDVEPVSLNEAKLYLRHEVSEESPPVQHPDDVLIAALIEASREWAEAFQNRAYITQTWRVSMEAFPAERYIELPKPPLQSLVSLSYWDGSTTQVVSFVDPSGTILLETDDYMVDTESQPGRLCLKPGCSWPTVTSRAKAVQVEFVCGYGDASDDVPERIRTAILLKVSDLYENRGDEPPKNAHGAPLTNAVKALLWPERIIPI